MDFAQYMVERLKQCGAKYVFGVPGDFNLEMLDYIERDEHLEWVGNANELNAAYAADGYARMKGSLAAVITTFGVGELSALNGIAGSLAERVPVLHIVGSPSRSMQASNTLLHHTLNLPTSYTAYAQMSAPLSCSQALLSKIEPSTDRVWPDAFDKVVKDVLEQCRPGYVEIPTDAVKHKVSPEGLKKRLPHPHSAPPPENVATGLPVDAKSDDPSSSQPINGATPSAAPSDEVTEHVVAEITKRFAEASRPIVLVDACAGRFGMAKTVRKLVEGANVRFFETPMGKALLDEHHPLYGGCYAGANSLPEVKNEVESADFVLYVGALKSDFNSGSFSVGIDTKITVELHSFTTTIGYASYPTTDIRHILPLLVPAFASAVASKPKEVHGVSLSEKQEKQLAPKAPVGLPDVKEIKHDWMWRRLGEWFEDNDVIITETGTSSYGLENVPLPSNSTSVSQILWGAIGWSVGATLGVALAAEKEDVKRRTILFVGDGSLQLTVQEVGTMIRRGVCPYLFVLNNDGYEIERQIHGWEAKYNDIQPYDHQLLLPFFAGKKSKMPYESIAVHTPEELDSLLKDESFRKADKIRLIEVFMPRGDAPEMLVKQAKLTAEANSKA